MFLAAHCTGQHMLFDPRHEHEPPAELRARHLIALDVCAGCPCTTSCAVLADTLPRASWGGVWAGRSVELPDLTTRREDPAL